MEDVGERGLFGMPRLKVQGSCDVPRTEPEGLFGDWRCCPTVPQRVIRASAWQLRGPAPEMRALGRH
jgi:hypothetical protein